MFKLNNEYTTDFNAQFKAIFESTTLPADLINHIIKPMMKEEFPPYDQLDNDDVLKLIIDTLYYNKTPDADEPDYGLRIKKAKRIEFLNQVIPSKLNGKRFLFMKPTKLTLDHSRNYNLHRDLKNAGYKLFYSSEPDIVILSRDDEPDIIDARKYMDIIENEYHKDVMPTYWMTRIEEDTMCEQQQYDYEAWLQTDEAQSEILDEMMQSVFI